MTRATLILADSFQRRAYLETIVFWVNENEWSIYPTGLRPYRRNFTPAISIHADRTVHETVFTSHGDLHRPSSSPSLSRRISAGGSISHLSRNPVPQILLSFRVTADYQITADTLIYRSASYRARSSSGLPCPTFYLLHVPFASHHDVSVEREKSAFRDCRKMIAARDSFFISNKLQRCSAATIRSVSEITMIDTIVDAFRNRDNFDDDSPFA